MRRIFWLVTLTPLAFAGRLGIGISAGGQQYGDYRSLTVEQLPTLFYGSEFHIQAEALPHFYLEPLVSYYNNPGSAKSGLGFGLRANIQPRLGKFPLAPFFGVEGLIVLYNNDVDIGSAFQSDRLAEYIESSTPGTIGLGFAGVTLFLGKALSIDCQYRYLSFTRNYGVEMTWVGLTWYINW